MSTAMTITFLGVGSAFTTTEYYQSNLLISAASGKKMLIDCGSDARLSLAEWSLRHEEKCPDIDAVYISHLHSDHIGGLEWLAFNSYFNQNMARPKLFLVEDLASKMWDRVLRGGLECIAEKTMGLSDYYEPIVVSPSVAFQWENIRFTPFRTIHVNNAVQPMYSFGLVMRAVEQEEVFIFTTDTILDQNLINLFAAWEPRVRFIFQDCETADFRTGVHAHYTELCSLPEKLRNKMWLYHYNPHPTHTPVDDGFLGFVRKGQIFR